MSVTVYNPLRLSYGCPMKICLDQITLLEHHEVKYQEAELKGQTCMRFGEKAFVRILTGFALLGEGHSFSAALYTVGGMRALKKSVINSWLHDIGVIFLLSLTSTIHAYWY